MSISILDNSKHQKFQKTTNLSNIKSMLNDGQARNSQSNPLSKMSDNDQREKEMREAIHKYYGEPKHVKPILLHEVIKARQ